LHFVLQLVLEKAFIEGFQRKIIEQDVSKIVALVVLACPTMCEIEKVFLLLKLFVRVLLRQFHGGKLVRVDLHVEAEMAAKRALHDLEELAQVGGHRLDRFRAQVSIEEVLNQAGVYANWGEEKQDQDHLFFGNARLRRI
tara:strand:- start:1164 stop:1583 length:420 start_codon:yes stop_codon:yes gene_type:complete